MQNLISKNPIQRFKQGKQIEKFENPSRPIEKRSYKSNYDKNYVGGGQKIINWFSSLFNSPQQTTRIGMSGKPIVDTIQKNSNKTVQQQNVPVIGKTVDSNKYAGSTFRGYSSKGASSTQGNSGLVNNKSKVITSRNRPKNYGFGKMGGWNHKIGDITDQESIRMLQEMGLSGSAQDIQQKINEKFGANSVKVDNKWGNQSRTGLKALYDEWKNVKGPAPTPVVESALDEAYQTQKPSNQPSAFPKIEMPYTSTGTYDLDKSGTLKNLGIRDYNSLVNYVNTNPGSSIASDLKQRFGETSTWNQQDFENQIGIGGHYGRINRNALWGYLNGLKQNYNNKYLQQLGYMTLMRKQGGQLVSRNPITRFKNKNK